MKGFPRALSRAPIGTEQFIRRVRYPIVNKVITVTATGSADAFGFGSVGGLPQGNVMIVGGASYLTITTADVDPSATWSGRASFGTLGSVDLTFSGLEVNLVAETAIGPAVAKTITGDKGRVAGAAVSMIDNTANTLNVNLNLAIANADMADANAADLTVNGYVDLFLAVIGDD
jgi:hypothetical protein